MAGNAQSCEGKTIYTKTMNTFCIYKRPW